MAELSSVEQSNLPKQPNHEQVIQTLTEKIATTPSTGMAFNLLAHERVAFSPYGETWANFLRARVDVGNKTFLGTNHEASTEELQLVDTFVSDVLNRHCDVVYIEQGSVDPSENLNSWLESHGYLKPDRDAYCSELTYLAKSLTNRGVHVVNIDLAHNPAALPYAIHRYGINRTIRNINWDLLAKTISFDQHQPVLDESRIPEIITHLMTEAGVPVSLEKVLQTIDGRDISNLNDQYTNDEREEYMIQCITSPTAAVAAHTGHIAALLYRIVGNEHINHLHLLIDTPKIKSVVTECNRFATSNTH